MKNSYNTVDEKTGTVNYNGPSEITKGNHNGMPSRTDAYLPGDERGHVQASSLGGSNTAANVVPQNADVNHGAYYSMEQGERNALNDGAQIHSDKTAYVSSQPGQRPDAFMVNDEITYADGHMETVHLSFQNEGYAEQEAWNEQSAALLGTFDAPNPDDGLRSSMTSDEYGNLMNETDQALPGISDEYAPADFSGAPSSELDANSSTGSNTTSTAEGTFADAGENGAEADAGDTGADVDSGADADPD